MSVEVDSGDAEPDETREERLLHIGVLLEGHVLDDRWQLVVVTDHDPALQAVVTVTWILKAVVTRRITSYKGPFNMRNNTQNN